MSQIMRSDFAECASKMLFVHFLVYRKNVKFHYYKNLFAKLHVVKLFTLDHICWS